MSLRPDKSLYGNAGNASAAQADALHGFCTQVRELNERAILLDAETGELEALSEALRKLNAKAAALQGGRMLGFFRSGFGSEQCEGLQPYSPVGGTHNPVTPALRFRIEGNTVLAEAEYRHAHEGPPNAVHGGIVAAVFDQVMAATCVYHQRAGFTASLAVHYHEPTPLLTKLVFSAAIEKTEDRKTWVRASCTAGDEVTASAEGLFIYHQPGPA